MVRGKKLLALYKSLKSWSELVGKSAMPDSKAAHHTGDITNTQVPAVCGKKKHFSFISFHSAHEN